MSLRAQLVLLFEQGCRHFSSSGIDKVRAWRAIRELSTERYEILVPSEVYHCTPSGGYTALRARSICPPTRSSGTCTPKLYKLLRLNFKLFHNSETFQLFPAPINNPAAERRGIKPSARIKCKVLKWTTFMGRRGSVCVPFRAKAW